MGFLKNVIINILSQGLFIIVQQIFLFPNFEKSLGQEQFGYFLIVYGFCNVLIITLNTSFTNLYQKNYHTFIGEYKDKNALYAYYKLLMKYIVLFSIVIYIPALYLNLKTTTYILIVLIVLFTSSRMFLLVFYRVQRKFVSILKVNIILSLMYVVLYFFEMSSVESILLGFTLIEILINFITYIAVRVDIRTLISASKINIKRAALFFLIISGAVGSLMNYSDRFITNYLFDSSVVTVYYIATLPTKIMLFPVTMVSSVILSYIANTDTITKKIKHRIYIYLPVISLVVFIVSYFVGIVLIRILYGNYVDSIKDVYLLVTITFSLICSDYIIRSFLVKYYSLKRKALLDTFTLLLFLVLAFTFYFFTQNLIIIAIAQLCAYGCKICIQILILENLKTNASK